MVVIIVWFSLMSFFFEKTYHCHTVHILYNYTTFSSLRFRNAIFIKVGHTTYHYEGAVSFFIFFFKEATESERQQNKNKLQTAKSFKFLQRLVKILLKLKVLPMLF